MEISYVNQKKITLPASRHSEQITQDIGFDTKKSLPLPSRRRHSIHFIVILPASEIEIWGDNFGLNCDSFGLNCDSSGLPDAELPVEPTIPSRLSSMSL